MIGNVLQIFETLETAKIGGGFVHDNIRFNIRKPNCMVNVLRKWYSKIKLRQWYDFWSKDVEPCTLHWPAGPFPSMICIRQFRPQGAMPSHNFFGWWSLQIQPLDDQCGKKKFLERLYYNFQVRIYRGKGSESKGAAIAPTPFSSSNVDVAVRLRNGFTRSHPGFGKKIVWFKKTVESPSNRPNNCYYYCM